MQINTKTKIFEKAVNLFASKGYSATSIREIARYVGIKESSIYNHFSGKNAIFQAILEYQMDGFKESVAALDELSNISPEISDPLEFWMAGAQAFIKVQRPLAEPISRIIINEMLLNQQCGDFILENLYRAQKDLTEQIFRIMYEKGMIIKCDFRKMAMQYVYMIQGLEIENKLRALRGAKTEDILSSMLEQMTLFIGKMRR